jgi:hypothetical protein
LVYKNEISILPYISVYKNIPEITWDNNHYNYINILHSTIKYFASKQISIISLLWVYSKHEIKNIVFLGGIFRKKLIRDAVNIDVKEVWT